DGPVAAALRELDRGERLGQRPDLVRLDQDRVRDALAHALLQDLRVRDEEVVSDELDLRTEALGQLAPAAPVVLREAVLDRYDRIAVGEPGQIVGEFPGRKRQPFGLEQIAPVLEE